MADEKDQKPYEVGHGKPPKWTRFQKGKSGNPNGRPKGSQNAKSIVNKIAFAPMPLTVNGRERMGTTLEGILIIAANDALKGDAKARRDFFALVRLYGEIEAQVHEPEFNKQELGLKKSLEDRLIEALRIKGEDAKKSAGTTEDQKSPSAPEQPEVD